MRCLIDLRLLVLAIGGLPAALGVFGSPAAIAEDQTSSENVADVRVVRENLMNIMETYERIFEKYKLDDELLASLIEAQQHMKSISDEHLAVMADAIAPKVAKLNRLVNELGRIARTGRDATRRTSTPDKFPGADYPNVDFTVSFPWADAEEGDSNEATDGSGTAFCNGMRMSPNARYNALRNVLLAEGIRDIASRICNQVVLGNISLFCIPTDILYIVAKFFHEGLELCENLIDGAEVEASYDRLGHVHTDMDALTIIAKHTEEVVVAQAGELALHVIQLTDHDVLVNERLDAVDTALALAQHTLDTVIELRSVHLQIIEIKTKERYLLTATEGGQPVDVTILGVWASDAQGKPITFVALDFVARSTGSTGLVDIEIDLPSKLSNAKLFQFLVKDSHSDHDHYGTTIYPR